MEVWSVEWRLELRLLWTVFTDILAFFCRKTTKRSIRNCFMRRNCIIFFKEEVRKRSRYDVRIVCGSMLMLKDDSSSE